MKNIKSKILGRKVLSFVLTVTLLVGLMPGNMLTVSAEGTDTVISDELIVESVSSNDASSATECTCGTDDPAFHAINCPAYIAPENPQCYCAEKCTEDTLNIWCDVCGVQGVSACQGEDTAVAYEIVASGTCGAEGNESSVTWSLDSDGTLTISGTGAMADYELVEDYSIYYTTPWHDTDNDGRYQNSNIKKVVVEEGVTHIGNSAFKDFTELTSISIPNTVKSIGYGSVSYCNKLTSLVIPDSVTSIGEKAFYDNTTLTSVTIGDSVETIGKKAFYGMGRIACIDFTITLPKSVTYIAPDAFMIVYRGATIRYSCSYNEGNGYSTGNSTFYATLEQYHLCEYSSSGNKINCSGCTCGEYSSSTATLSLSSDEPIYYTGEEIKPAVTVTYPDDWGGDKIEPNESNCTYSYNINVGTATCTFKYAEGVEASLDFTIEKADSVITAAPTPADLVYDGTALNLINAGTTTDGEMQYSLDGTNYSPTIPTGTDAKTYTVWYKVDGDENHNDTTPASIEVAIAKAEITSITDFGVVAPVAGETPQSSVSAGTGYTAEISWQPDDTSYAPNTVYTATVTLTADTNHSFADSITVSGWDKSVDADKLVFTKEFDATGKLECDVIVPTANILTYNGSAQELVTAGTVPDGCEMQYKLGDDGTFSAEIPTATDANTYKVYWKVVGNDTYNDIDNGDYVEVTINKATPTSDMFTATPSSELVYDGTEKSIIVTTDKVGMGAFTVSYVSFTDSTQPVEAGIYIVRLHIEEGDNYIADDTLSFVAFEIRKADSVITAAPTPADLVYDGTAQNLINAGTATGGEMQYSLDGTNYSSAIPTGTDAKTYTVWYKVVGDDNHNDTEPKKVEVTIAPKTVEIISVTASDRVFDGTNTVEISEVIISGILNTDNVSASATATINSMNAGDYTTVDLSNITLTGSAASNYSIATSVKDVPLTTPVTISKASAPTLSSGSKAYVYSIGYEGESVSITGLPTNCGEVEYSLLSVSSDMFENVSVDANGKITYDVKELDSYTDDLQGTISVNVVMKNYETAIYTLTITRTEKISQNISAEDITLTYGDADATISVIGAKTGLTYEVISDSNNNGDVITVDVNGEVSIENAGTAIIKITAKESDTYAESECEIRVTVKQVAVNIKADSYTVKKGDTLPTFEYDVTGLVNGDTLPITVSVACTASDTKTEGTYDITVSGVSSEGNYTYVYTNGVLEVLAEDEAPFIMGDDGKMGWDAISDAIDDTGEGENIKVDMNGATVVPGDIIEEARDKGITISFVLDNGLTWTIDGSTVSDGEIGNINFDTTVEDENNPLNNIPVDVINGVTGEKATIEVNLTYSGNFGFTAGLKANLGSDNAGYYANLYYYNPTTGKLEYVCADMIAANGDAELTFTHASDYLIVIDDEDLGKVKEDTNTNTNTGNNTNTNTGNNNTGNNNTDNNSATTTPAATNGTVSNNTKVVSPDTGDEGAFWIWMLMLASLLGMAGAIGTKRVSGKKN